MHGTYHLPCCERFYHSYWATKTWNKGRTASVEDANEDDEEWFADWNNMELIPDEQEVDDEMDFTPGDTLGKALALVNQVCSIFDVYGFILILFVRFGPHPKQKCTL